MSKPFGMTPEVYAGHERMLREQLVRATELISETLERRVREALKLDSTPTLYPQRAAAVAAEIARLRGELDALRLLLDRHDEHTKGIWR